MKNIFMIKKKKGFVSIFAIFFSAIIVSVLTAIYILLMKQIELLSLDYLSFQSLYVADSLFECAVYKEQIATSSRSFFLPANYTAIGGCKEAADLTFDQQPTISTFRAISKVKMGMSVQGVDFCAYADVNKETRDTSQFTTAPVPDSMTFSGQSRACGGTDLKVVERLIEFIY